MKGIARSAPARLASAASGAPPALQRALRAETDMGPSAAELADLARRLSPWLAGPVGASGADAQPASPSPDAPAAPVIEAPPPAPPPVPVSPDASALAAVPGSVGVVAALGALLAAGAIAGAALNAPPARVAPARSILAWGDVPLLRLDSPPAPEPIPEARLAELPEAAEQPDPRPGAGATVPPAANAVSPPSAMQASGLDRELSVIAAARRALARDPARALVATEQHRAAFPAGRLTEERELIAIAALLSLRRRAEGEERARAFRASYPGSAHMRRIDRLLQQDAGASE